MTRESWFEDHCFLYNQLAFRSPVEEPQITGRFLGVDHKGMKQQRKKQCEGAHANRLFHSHVLGLDRDLITYMHGHGHAENTALTSGSLLKCQRLNLKISYH